MNSDDTSTPDLAVAVRGLRRRYGGFEAVRGVDLDVPTGSVTALLGTNGAGKTSTLEVVEGLARPSAGSVSVLGLDPVADRPAVRRRTGVLLQRSGFPGDLTVREVLELRASTTTHPRPVPEALGLLRLEHRADVRVAGLSGGEQRRLDLACALIGRPELVVLDEPTTGLDPETRRDVWALLRGLVADGGTVLFSTHHLEEVESLADRVVILHEGVVVRSGTPAGLVGDHPASITFRTPATGVPAVAADHVLEEHGVTTLRTRDLQATLTALLVAADRDGTRLEELQARSASLESVFLAVADGGPAAVPAQRAPETTGAPA